MPVSSSVLVVGGFGLLMIGAGMWVLAYDRERYQAA
jgi:hypothetical protein